jgi:GNAT superfamily N-acetyltransferase
MNSNEIYPLTPDRWSDFEQLFGSRGGCAGCWCMYWKLRRKDFQTGQGENNRLAQKKNVLSGLIPGLIAYKIGKPAGWLALEPRDNYPVLNNSKILKAIDDIPVWSIPCFFVSKELRNQGISEKLIIAAIKYVAAQGGKVVESYPVEVFNREMSPPMFVYTGLASAFIKAGFKEICRRSEKRPIMRYIIER